MIDLILWASTKAAFATFARNNPPANPLQQQDGTDEQGNPIWVNRPGFQYVWWAGSGKLMTQAGTYDADRNELTPPTYLNGFVALVRISGQFFDDNRLVPDGADPDKLEQWARSKIAKWVKDNGTPGTMGGIPYYEVSGVRMFRPNDVTAFLASRNLPGHEWLGGNSF